MVLCFESWTSSVFPDSSFSYEETSGGLLTAMNLNIGKKAL
jgi:hypothetical protein